MIKTILSWVLVGVLAFVWWWFAHRWSYLHSPGNQWSSMFVMFTLISLAILVRRPAGSGQGMFAGMIDTIRGFVPVLPWIALAAVVVRATAWITTGAPVDPLDHFTRAIVAALLAAATTAFWYGAIENGMRTR